MRSDHLEVTNFHEKILGLRRKNGISRQLYHKRITEGWSPLEAATTPPTRAPWVDRGWALVDLSEKIHDIHFLSNQNGHVAVIDLNESTIIGFDKTSKTKAVMQLISKAALQIGFIQICKPNSPALHEVWKKAVKAKQPFRKAKPNKVIMFTSDVPKKKKKYHFEEIEIEDDEVQNYSKTISEKLNEKGYQFDSEKPFGYDSEKDILEDVKIFKP